MALFNTANEAWVTEYEGHRIEVVNTKKLKLLIDGEEADQQKGIIAISCTLRGTLPDSGKGVIAIINGAENWGNTCHIIIGTELSTQHGYKDSKGEFSLNLEKDADSEEIKA